MDYNFFAENLSLSSTHTREHTHFCRLIKQSRKKVFSSSRDSWREKKNVENEFSSVLFVNYVSRFLQRNLRIKPFQGLSRASQNLPNCAKQTMSSRGEKRVPCCCLRNSLTEWNGIDFFHQITRRPRKFSNLQNCLSLKFCATPWTLVR